MTYSFKIHANSYKLIHKYHSILWLVLNLTKEADLVTKTVLSKCLKDG